MTAFRSILIALLLSSYCGDAFRVKRKSILVHDGFTAENLSSYDGTHEKTGIPWLHTALNVLGNHHGALLIDTAQYAENVRVAVNSLRCPFDIPKNDQEFCIDMQVLAVMKANAYGRGVGALAPMAQQAGASYIGVVDNWEAKAAREAKWTLPLFRMRGATTLEAGDAMTQIGIEEWIGSEQAAVNLNAAALLQTPNTDYDVPERLIITDEDGRPQGPISFGAMPELPVHFALGGPMNRNAFATRAEASKAAKSCLRLCVVGLLLHMPVADTEPQTTIDTFKEFYANVVPLLQELFTVRGRQSELCQKRKIVIHWANSPTAIRFGNSHAEYLAFRDKLKERGFLPKVTFMARLGKSLFGLQSVDWNIKPCPAFGHLDGSIAPRLLDPQCPKPSMGPTFNFVTWGHQVHTFKKGKPVPVGYGSPELTSKRRGIGLNPTLATLPVGWADGIPDSIGNVPSQAHWPLEIDHEYGVVKVDDKVKAHPGRVRIVGAARSAMGYVVGKLSMNMTVVDASGLGLGQADLENNMFLYVMLGDGVTVPPGSESRGNVNIGKSADSNAEILRVNSNDPLWRFFSLALMPNSPDGERFQVWQALQKAHQLENSPSELQAARGQAKTPIPGPTASKLVSLKVKAIEAHVVLNPGDLMYLRQKILANPELAERQHLLLDRRVSGYPFSGSLVRRNIELIYEKALEKQVYSGLEAAVQAGFGGAKHPKHVLLVSGFYVLHEMAQERPPQLARGSAETDGPLGVLALTRAFAAHGIRVSLFTDPHNGPVIEAGFKRMMEFLNGVDQQVARNLVKFIRVLPRVSDARATKEDAANNHPKLCVYREDQGKDKLLNARGLCVAARLKKAVADAWSGEHSVTIDGIFALERLGYPYKNIRGRDLSEHTEAIDFLWPTVGQPRLMKQFRTAAGIAENAISFGIGDGGNEVGMGKYVTLAGIKDLVPPVSPALGFATLEINGCQRTADHVVIATVSNWGGSAVEMAAQVMFPPDASLNYIQKMINNGQEISSLEQSILQRIMEQPHFSVDGISPEAKLSVDGMNWSPSHQNLYDGLWAISLQAA